MNAFFSFSLFMVYIQECKQQLINYKLIHAEYEILHTLYLDCSFYWLPREKNSPEKTISADIFLNIHSQMEAFSKCCLLEFNLINIQSVLTLNT